MIKFSSFYTFKILLLAEIYYQQCQPFLTARVMNGLKSIMIKMVNKTLTYVWLKSYQPFARFTNTLLD